MRIDDPLFPQRLRRILQSRGSSQAPVELPVLGAVITIPGEDVLQALLERAKPVQIVPGSSGDFAFYSTRVRLTSPAVAGNFSWAAVAVAPHSTARRITELQLVAVRAACESSIKTAFIKLDGHLGAAPAAPNATMLRLFEETTSQAVDDSVETASTSQTGSAAADDAVGSFAAAERLLEYRFSVPTASDWVWPRGSGGISEGDAAGIPLPSRRVVQPSPHLCGFVVGVVGSVVNSALTVGFQIIVREFY